jgi:hypothetical protein
MIVLVTVKLPRDPKHDPHNKVAGLCPVSGFRCTDVTGEHHTVMVDVPLEGDTSAAVSQAEAYVRSEEPGIHITRSEAFPWAEQA